MIQELDTSCTIEQAVDEYLSDYTMDGDSEFHMPTDAERFLIKDAVMGLLVDPMYLAAQSMDAQHWKEKYAIAQHSADCLDAKCSDLLTHNGILMDAATKSLELLRKGAPGWGQAKDILNFAIYRKRLEINTNDERNAI